MIYVALSIGALIVAAILWRRSRRPKPFGQWYREDFEPEVRRKVEERQLAELEEAGPPLWRPDRSDRAS